MQKIDPAFLFEMGDQLKAVATVNRETPPADAYFKLSSARTAVEQISRASVYSHLLRSPCQTAAAQLTNHLHEMTKTILGMEDLENGKLDYVQVLKLHGLYTKFETLFVGELQASAVYLVQPKGGYDTDRLTEAGDTLFSVDLFDKVPDSLDDLMQATRCIAFELPTAAGFHLHRAHEAVLRVYWDCVTGGLKRPKQQNMGEYLKQLDKLEKGRPAVRSHLRSIKDFHRNPLMHPEQSLSSTDEAIDLLSAIRCSIGYMLQEIPGEANAPLLEHMEDGNALAPLLSNERQRDD